MAAQANPNPAANVQAPNAAHADEAGIQSAMAKMSKDQNCGGTWRPDSSSNLHPSAQSVLETASKHAKEAQDSTVTLGTGSDVHHPGLPSQRNYLVDGPERANQVKHAGSSAVHNPLSSQVVQGRPSGSTQKARFWKIAAQDNTSEQRSSTGDSTGLTFAHKDDDYAKGQDAWEATSKYFRSGSQGKTQPNPFKGQHSTSEKAAVLYLRTVLLLVASQANPFCSSKSSTKTWQDT